MLPAKMSSSPTAISADSAFDILERIPDGNFLCIAKIRGLGEAESYVSRLAPQRTSHYLIHCQGLVF